MGDSRKYTTIPVSIEVKEMLNRLRGNKDWSEFLRDLVQENIRLKRVIAARRIQERFDSKVEKSIRESHLLFRKSFRLRDILEGGH